MVRILFKCLQHQFQRQFLILMEACRPDSLVGFSGSRTCSSSGNIATFSAASKSTFNIKTETPSSLPLSEQGCSGGTKSSEFK